MYSTDGTCVVTPRSCAAATPAGPDPGPATSIAICLSCGRVGPNRVHVVRQYRPLRTRTTGVCASAAIRDSAVSTAAVGPVRSRDQTNVSAGNAASCSRTLVVVEAIMTEKRTTFLAEAAPLRPSKVDKGDGNALLFSVILLPSGRSGTDPNDAGIALSVGNYKWRTKGFPPISRFSARFRSRRRVNHKWHTKERRARKVTVLVIGGP
jgi:hypothetical protein